MKMDSAEIDFKFMVFVSVAAMAAVALLAFSTKRRLKFENIFLYPVKSCKGISVEEAVIDRFGFLEDRRFMLIDENNLFVSQRNKNRMAQISVRFDKDAVEVSAPECSDLRFSKTKFTSEIIECTLWDDQVKCAVVSEEANRWFSKFLNFPCKLVAQNTESYERKLSPKWADPKVREANIEVNLADGYPLLLISQASVDFLNEKLEKEDQITVRNFRPNLYVSGCRPHEEDEWKVIKIGDLIFDNVKPCDRCSMPTVNQDTGKRNKKYEPVKALRKYRNLKGDEEVYFGVNLVPRKSTGTIRLDDPIEILELHH